MDELITQVAHHLRRAERILFITGAGLSADSGLPTYRGIGGLYNEKLTAEDVPIEEALSGHMLLQRPELTWKYIAEVERACRGADFNAGHQVMAEIEAQKPGTWILTQNVDGFHRRAGSRNLIEIHGRITDLYCTACPYAQNIDDFSNLHIPPACPQCGKLLRPDVVLFGEMLPQAPVEKLYNELNRGFDLVFSVGTTSVFPYIAEPVRLARNWGAPTVEINPGETEISHLVDYQIRAGAADVLTRLWTVAS
jgi:NAD-dependent deacetylase